jgi:hypothetical protein
MKSFIRFFVELSGERLVVRNMDIPFWSIKDEPDKQVSGMYLFGNDIYVHNNLLKRPKEGPGYVTLGFDGIHLWGGARAHFMNNEVLAGDDGIGLFPQRIKSFGDCPNPYFNFNISGAEIFNNRLSSLGSRAFACGIPFGPTTASENDEIMTCETKYIRARNLAGNSGGVNAMVAVLSLPASLNAAYSGNPIPPAQVHHVRIEDVVVVADWTSIGQTEDGSPLQVDPSFPQQSIVKHRGVEMTTNDVGSLSNITLVNVNTIGATKFGLLISQRSAFPVANQNIVIHDCYFDSRDPRKKMPVSSRPPGWPNTPNYFPGFNYYQEGVYQEFKIDGASAVTKPETLFLGEVDGIED